VRALITGSCGFVGPHLAKLLRAERHQVTGFSLSTGDDIRDYEQVLAAVRHAEPDMIFHLAAVSWPRESLTGPRRCMDVNVTGAFNLLEAVRHCGAETRILLAGTSEQYGYDGRDGEKLTEESPCRPTTPYGVSKLAAEQLGLMYARRWGLNVVCTRAFNHTGWGRQANNAESAFARRIVAFERGESSIVEHGDLSAVRNFTDVRDVVRAYLLAIWLDPGVYNICSDTNVPMATVMDELLAVAGANVPLKESFRLGHGDNPGFPLPSHDKLTRATGWGAQHSLRETMGWLLSYWRAR